MKSFVFALLTALFGAQQAVACARPPDMTYLQPAQIVSILQDHEVMQSLRNAGGRDILDITLTGNRLYRINASNGCYVEVEVTYLPPAHRGMCPSESEASVVKAGCSDAVGEAS